MRMKPLYKILIVMSLGIIGSTCFAQAPKGKLTYCSYSKSGAAGLGKDYCELIADPGQAPKVVVALNLGNRFGDPEIHAEYPVGEDVVAKLSEMLADAKVYTLNGYSVEEHMNGGTTYRIYQEYDSGEKINAHWYGHDIKPEARSAYHMIESFFQPWRSQALRENDPAVVFEISARLISLGAISLGDYNKDDALDGGTIYSVSLTYASGAKQKLYWHSHDVDPKALAVYNRIRAFFEPWVK